MSYEQTVPSFSPLRYTAEIDDSLNSPLQSDFDPIAPPKLPWWENQGLQVTKSGSRVSVHLTSQRYLSDSESFLLILLSLLGSQDTSLSWFASLLGSSHSPLIPGSSSCYAPRSSPQASFLPMRLAVARQDPLSRGILQEKIRECAAMPSSRGSSQPSVKGLNCTNMLKIPTSLLQSEQHPNSTH